MKLQDTKILIHIINTEDVQIETLKIKKEELGDEIEKAVGGFFTSAGRFESGDTLYVNDTGANDLAMADYMFTVPHYMAPLFGNGVVVGSTPWGRNSLQLQIGIGFCGMLNSFESGSLSLIELSAQPHSPIKCQPTRLKVNGFALLLITPKSCLQFEFRAYSSIG